MSKQYTIPIDCPDGWEPVRFGEVKSGEHFVHDINDVLTVSGDGVAFPRLIVRRVYQFPAFLPEGWWIAMDLNGYWYVFDSEPILAVNQWRLPSPLGNGRCTCLHHLAWTPPEVTDWRQSKMQVRR